MIRAGFFVCALLFVLTASSCAPPSERASAAPMSCDISQKIRLLGLPGFSPTDYGGCTAGSACPFADPTKYVYGSPSDDQVKAIVAAYDVAPPFLKASLCSLYAIYVDSDPDPTKSPAWGMRERRFPDPSGGYRTHIGFSARLLTALETAQTPYAWYETAILRNLAVSPFSAPPDPPPTLPPRSAAWLKGVTFTAKPDPAPVRPEAIALLGVLAHEMGHVLWFDRVVAATAPPSSNDPLPALDTFYPISWRTPNHQRGFHRFGDGNHDANARHPPVDADFVRDLKNADTSTAAAHLDKIYSGEWASLFATIAPDEDFVETYKLMVVSSAWGGPLQSLELSIPATGLTPVYTQYPLANLANTATTLYRKAQWIANCLEIQRGAPTCAAPPVRPRG